MLRVKLDPEAMELTIDGPLVARAERRAADLGSLVRWFVAPAVLEYLDRTDVANAPDEVVTALRQLHEVCIAAMHVSGRRLP
jgi:hypothetical protein